MPITTTELAALIVQGEQLLEQLRAARDEASPGGRRLTKKERRDLGLGAARWALAVTLEVAD